MGENTDLKKIRKLIQTEKRAAGEIFETGDFDRRITEALRSIPSSRPIGTHLRRGPIRAGIAGMSLGVVILAAILITLLSPTDRAGVNEIARLLAQSAASTGMSAPNGGSIDGAREDETARIEISWLIRGAHYRIHRRALDMAELREIFTRPPISAQNQASLLPESDRMVNHEELNLEQRIRDLRDSGQIERFLNKLFET